MAQFDDSDYVKLRAGFMEFYWIVIKSFRKIGDEIMSITERFSKGRVSLDLKAENKHDVLDELIDIFYADGKLRDKEAFRCEVFNREEEASTGIGLGIAMPHGSCKGVIEATIVFGKSKRGIEYSSMDGKPAHLFFLIAVPEEAHDIHLRILSEISSVLMDSEVRKRLMEADSYEDIMNIFEN
jgi:nitrogen PTS system EIIA component